MEAKEAAVRSIFSSNFEGISRAFGGNISCIKHSIKAGVLIALNCRTNSCLKI
jgi:hypothetical protein